MITKSPALIFKLNMLISLLMSILILLIVNIYPNTLKSIAIESLVSYIFFFISWFNHNKIKINFYSIFLAFTYFFFFGQFFLMLFNIPMESGRTILDGLLPLQTTIETGELIISSMVILHLGVIISTFNIKKYYQKDALYERTKNISFQYSKSFRKVSILLFSVSIVPSFILLYQNISITLTQGYGAIFQSESYTSGGFNNIIRFVSLFTIPSFLMLLTSYRDSKKIKYINTALIIYLALYFISGSRLNGVLLLAILLLVKHYWYKPLTFKEALKIIVLAFVGLALLSTISEIRNALYTSNDINYLLKETFKNIIIKNPVFTTLEEAGYTFLATAAVVTYSPSLVPFQYGASYINGLAMIFPNLFWEVHPAALTNTDIVFKRFLTQYGGIGSSFIAEAYWNFGYGSLIVAFVFGLLIGTLTKKILKYSRDNNSKMFYLYIYIAQISLSYVRSDTISFWRNLIYYGIAPLIIVALLTKKKKGKFYE